LAVGRTNRFLHALSGAATSRVLNLASIAVANVQNPDHRSQPLFSSPVINSAILLKHRVRSDETYLFSDARLVATKIIVPFDIKDLRAGGRSFFIDQRGYDDMLHDVGIYGNDGSLAHDREVLRILNALPSLDPFLLREHLRAHSIDCAECYFEISQADRQRMHDYVASEIRKLIHLAMGGGGKANYHSTARLVTAMLSSEVDDKLEPLRQTLKMNGADFHEGVFSWRGFLYYKWSMEKFWPEIISVLRDIKSVQPMGAMDHARRSFLTESQRNIIEKVRDGGQLVRKILNVYDLAYEDLVQRQAPTTFRDFLLNAPHMFLELGDKMGAISHIVSFWRYRFPEKTRLTIDAEELTAIFQDFNSSFSGVVPNYDG
jgi:hypothetical protein